VIPVWLLSAACVALGVHWRLLMSPWWAWEPLVPLGAPLSVFWLTLGCFLGISWVAPGDSRCSLVSPGCLSGDSGCSLVPPGVAQ
jgi:hypothetical protein